MSRPDREPQKKPIYKRAWEAITRRGRKEAPVQTRAEAPVLRTAPLQRTENRPPQESLLDHQFRQDVDAYIQQRNEQVRQEQERQLQAQLAEQQQQEAERIRAIDERARLEKKRKREQEKGNQTREELTRDIQQIPMDSYAENIMRLWQNPHVPVYLSDVSEIDVKEQDDETLIDRSKVGKKLSYMRRVNYIYMDVRANYGGEGSETEHLIIERPSWQERKEELSFGIGYFGDREQILSDAQPLVSDEKLAKGVEAYFVQYSYPIVSEDRQKISEISETYAFPFSISGSKQIFVDFLFAVAKKSDPNIIIPKAEGENELNLL